MSTILINSILNLVSLFVGSYLTYYFLQTGEKRKDAKKLLKNKEQLCYNLIVILKSQMRLAYNFEIENIKFNYFNRLYVLPGFSEERKITNKEQAYFHQQKYKTYHDQLLNNMDVIEKFKFKFRLYFGKDDRFEILMNDYGSLSFRDHEKFKDFMNIFEMDEHKAKAIQQANNKIQEVMGTSVKKLEDLLQEKMKSKI